MNKQVLNVEKETVTTITSVELVEIINEFRMIENEATGKKYTELRHDSFMTKIKKELEVLKSVGLSADQNILEGEYTDKNNQLRPCFLLNASGMRTMLNSESTIVRAKTEQYINKLEKQIEELTQKDKLYIDLGRTGGSKAILIHKELAEIEISEAVEKEKDGNDRILNGGQVVKELKIPYLNTTILNEWFSINNFGTMVKINGSKNRTFQPSQKFLDIIAKSGYCLTGKTQKQDKIKVVYTKTLVDYLLENSIDSIKRYTFAKTGKEIA